MKAKIKIDGKQIEIEDIKKVSGLGKFSGLMFRKNSPALLFEFGRGRQAIHSLFCEPFIAVWILEGKVVEYRIIDKWLLSIAPSSEFDKLIVIPLNNKYNHLIENFAGKQEADE